MNSVVLMRTVPDVVEELEIGPDGRSLDPDTIRPIVCETDDHALEEALILKERHGGTVHVLAIAADGVDEILYAALAKGADGAWKIASGEMANQCTRAKASVFARAIERHGALLEASLVLTGVQAIDDLDGLMAPLVAHALKRADMEIVTSAVVDDAAGTVTVLKEFPSGVRGEFVLPLPAVLGIQAAEHPPRYVPVAKLRNAMKTSKIETIDLPPAEADDGGAISIVAMRKPKPTGHAEMLGGDPDQVGEKLAALLHERGVF